MEIISEKSLHFLFQKERKRDFLQFEANCCICGKRVEVKIVRESEGFGLLGGILYESGFDKVIVKCIDCNNGFCKYLTDPSSANAATTTVIHDEYKKP